ncbi:MAG: anion permease [Erysipelotrichaceae bacterium]|nr:anion permease [Erysipelotrichaceae bacterium]
MTTNMIITLAIVIAMIVIIISDKLPFGAPALLACAALVVTNQADIATAFKGFTDKNVVMIMGFMAAMAALQKTTFIRKMEDFLGNVAKKGGLGGFILLLLAIMAVSNVIGGTAYYMLVIALISTIPYNKELPTSRILLPAAMASGAGGWTPKGVVMFAGLVTSLCSSQGYDAGEASAVRMIIMNVAWSVVLLVWCIFAHRLLPDRDISDSLEEGKSELGEKKEFVKTLSDTQEKIVYVLYILLSGSMIFLSKFPGEVGYGLPLLIAGIFMACGIISFKEILNNMFSPVLIMMASVIGVAEVMGNCGLSAVIGQAIAKVLGANPGMFVLVLVFATLTSIMATFTGASFGSLFIFAPIGITLCLQYGYNPVPLTLACIKAAWINYFMPIDGMPSLVMGMGKYKLTEFWKFVIPQWILHMLLTCTLAVVLFG